MGDTPEAADAGEHWIRAVLQNIRRITSQAIEEIGRIARAGSRSMPDTFAVWYPTSLADSPQDAAVDI